MTLEQIITAFRTSPLPPRAALTAAVPEADGIAAAVYPLLERIRRGVVLKPDDRRVAVYGLHVLAAARRPDLWPELVALARLPEEELEDLFDAVAYDVLAPLMVSVWDGDADALIRLIEHADMGYAAKSALMHVLTRFTLDGQIARDVTVSFLERCEREGVYDEGDMIWWPWSDAVTLLGASELEPALRRVLEKPAFEGLSAEQRTDRLDKLARQAADPSDRTELELHEIEPVTDVVEALSWVESHAEADAEIRAEHEAELGPDNDVAKDVRLSDEEMLWLGRFLMSRQMPETTMSLECLDGFLTALVVGPKVTARENVLLEIFGSDDGSMPEWESAEQEGYFLEVIQRYMASIAVRREADAQHMPFILPREDDQGLEWADGFLTAVDMYEADWKPILSTKRGEEVMMAIYALVEDDAELFEQPISDSDRAAIVDGLPFIVQQIAAYWRDGQRFPRREPVRTLKIGRNDPCPCGSGKKYKKCCGDQPPPTVH